MDPASYCVYNVTRNALLSERVVSVSDSQTPSQLLALVMNGPGRDPHFCIRLTNVSVAPEIPRLFAFDVAYLDIEQRIIEVADVGPGTPFPAVTDQVASILFLSDQLLPKSGTQIGDYIRICTEGELAALLRAAAHFQQVESPGWPIESPGPPVTPDPFAGSLIFLPVSGTPQNSEIFLPSQHPHLETPDLAAQEMTDASLNVLSAPATQASDEPFQLVLDEIEPLQERESQESETQEPETQEPEPLAPPALPEQPLTRFFTTAFQQSPIVGNPQEKREEQPASQPSQLPFSLKAVIQFVDDQLRRERTGEEQLSQPREIPDPAVEPANTPAEESVEEFNFTEPSSAANQPMEALHPSENAEIAPDAPIEDVAEWSRFHARPIDEPEVEEVSPLLPETSLQESPSPPPASLAAQIPASVPLEPGQPPAPIEAVAAAPLAPASPPPARPLRQSPPMPPQAPELPQEKESPPRVSEPRGETERANAAGAKEKISFATRVQRWLAGESISLSGNRRRGERNTLPGLVAYYWTGGAPVPHEILNISKSGLYLRSKELWSPNTLVRMTLEKPDPEHGEKKSISILARVVRIDDGGIAHEFVTTEVLARLHARDFLPQQGTNRKELEKFLSP